MPFYDYKCPSCGHVVEKQFSIKDKPSTYEDECPECGDKVLFESQVSGIRIISGTSGFRVPGDFANRLQQIKQHYPKMMSTVTG